RVDDHSEPLDADARLRRRPVRHDLHYEVTAANMKDIESQMPSAICEIAPTNFAPNLLVNRKPPFDNTELRKAVAMTIDHKAFVDILGEGNGDIGTAVQPAPEGQWAMPKEMREKLPGYSPDIA